MKIAVERAKHLYMMLTYAGTLPFIFCAVLFVFKYQTLPILGSLQTVLKVYSTTILAFICGTYWGQHLYQKNKWAVYLLLTSNVNVLILCLCYLILPFSSLLSAWIANFCLLLCLDRALLLEGVISANYFKTRCLATLLVVLSLIISGVYA